MFFVSYRNRRTCRHDDDDDDYHFGTYGMLNSSSSSASLSTNYKQKNKALWLQKTEAAADVWFDMTSPVLIKSFTKIKADTTMSHTETVLR